MQINNNNKNHMHVGIITYQVGHLKTLQLLMQLITKSFRITLYAFPFKKKLIDSTKSTDFRYSERPWQILDYDVERFCRQYNIVYKKIGGWEDNYADELGSKNDKKQEDMPDVFLTCIAKIIPAAFIENRIIINAHPGLLPENRGVDAFKWSIVNASPVGISIHVIDEEIDRGFLLHRLRVSILEEDTLDDVAQRAYSMECSLQANFDYYLDSLKNQIKVSEVFPLSKKRIPEELDKDLAKIFLHNKKKLMQQSMITE